jgi:hypothetical protein
VLVGHVDAHASLARSLGEAAPEVLRLFVALQRRIFVESLAYVQPVVGRTDQPLLFPAPRAFLTRTQELRVVAASAAFRFLDARVAMFRQGLVERMLDPTLPVVLHALMEGVAPSGVETNAGMVRATPTSWKPEANAYVHPPAREAAVMLEAAIDMAMHAPAPAVARAGWLTFTMLSIHPFVDGNGRTSRTIFHAVAAEDPEVVFEWGVAEQWSLHRRAYVEALQAGQQMEAYDAERLDPLPFMIFSAHASALGAQLARARLGALGERLQAVIDRWGVTPGAAQLAVAVAMHRVATLAELRPLVAGPNDPEPATLVPMVDVLVDEGLVAWGDRPPSRRTRELPDPCGLRPSAELLSLVR